MSKAKEKVQEDVKPIIYDSVNKTNYQRGSFLGKGGFAKCYEFKNLSTGEVFAGKIVSKSMLIKPHHKEKMFQEINIHRSLSHKYIVSLHSYFQDSSNVYIILELCSKRSLMEMHKRRKTFTVPEARYFMRQILLACKYMHDNQVIHRDLKLGNLFLNDNMELKVGDFGLATRISFEGERKKTLCGTPNYIAPEILTKKGHSFEVDIWSLGCILYTLLVGSPPFETNTLKNTYSKIKKNDYFLPISMDAAAKSLIKKLLHPDPLCRPSSEEILMHDFLTNGYIPTRLPTSCLCMKPRITHNMSVFELTKNADRKPLLESGQLPSTDAAQDIFEENGKDPGPTKALLLDGAAPKDSYLSELLAMLDSILKCNPEALYTGQPEDAQDPSAVPFVWISKWVDYSDKYGIGYQLCDNSIGVFYNDSTHIVLLADGKNLQYIDADAEQFYTMPDYPPELKKKMTILNYFNTYMNENLLKAGESARPREGDEMSQVPHLRAWFRTKTAIVFHLSNGTFQANFFQDHTKIILCPIMSAVSYIDEEKNFSVYTVPLIEKYGCLPSLTLKLNYARGMIDRLLKS
ncbi:serine/threonine-protein kinase PLK1-like [Uloborus diversus]|uniref:serine/threonine-protein kinase PLK1-like n=1 Tax=Uloborus diversus TaxID=327109 RepID=UPI00240A57DD|nr:serine/threonine-protein kinase PLK1-like [Uloborus diversus]